MGKSRPAATPTSKVTRQLQPSRDRNQFPAISRLSEEPSLPAEFPRSDGGRDSGDEADDEVAGRKQECAGAVFPDALESELELAIGAELEAVLSKRRGASRRGPQKLLLRAPQRHSRRQGRAHRSRAWAARRLARLALPGRGSGRLLGGFSRCAVPCGGRYRRLLSAWALEECERRERHW